MLSLLYVSCSAIAPTDLSGALDDIEAVSIARNTQVDVTGLLIGTSDHFAAVLEGPACAVNALMAGIAIDPRHRDLRIIRRSESTARRFPQWRTVRLDGGRHAGIGLDALLAACHAGDDAIADARLDRLIQAIALDNAPSRSTCLGLAHLRVA